MKSDGDPRWSHDDECAPDHPCLDCLREEEDRECVERVKAALTRAGFGMIHVERGNAYSEVVVAGVSVWSIREALRVARESR